MPKSKMANRGKSALWPAIAKELMPWVNDRRQKGLSISSTELHLKALNVSKTIQDTKDFKASIDWCYGFMRRHDLSFRHCTHIFLKQDEL
jgi:hypothetical protein